MYQSYLIGSIVLNVLLLVTVVFRPDVRYPVYSCQNVLETREEKSYLRQDVSCNCTVATDDSVPILEKCSEWALLLDELERSYPSSIFDKEIPLTLEKFYAFAHRVFFAHGWEFMPGGNYLYEKSARWNPPGSISDRENVKAGLMRPGYFNNFFMGQVIQKYPQDLWLTQELLFDFAPEVIVELGSFHGAAAAFYAAASNAMKMSTEVISIDIISGEGNTAFFENLSLENLKYLKYTQGDLDPDAIDYVTQRLRGVSGAFIFLDSDHRASHVMMQLKIYASLVPVGGFIIVEDTNIDKNPICQRRHGTSPAHTKACGGSYEGPAVAVKAFFENNTMFTEFTAFNKINRISQNMHSVFVRNE